MLTLQLPKYPILETERLLLRAHQIQDAVTLFAMRTDEQIMKFIDRDRPEHLADIQEMIRNFTIGFETRQNLTWVITLKENPEEMVGGIGFYRMNLANHRAEVGYMLHPDYWRKGIVAEALKKVIEFGFQEMKLHSIQANINPGNEASRQILLKHGFVKEAYFREDYYFNGKFLDSEIYSLLQEDVNWGRGEII